MTEDTEIQNQLIRKLDLYTFPQRYGSKALPRVSNDNLNFNKVCEHFEITFELEELRQMPNLHIDYILSREYSKIIMRRKGFESVQGIEEIIIAMKPVLQSVRMPVRDIKRWVALWIVFEKRGRFDKEGVY